MVLAAAAEFPAEVAAAGEGFVEALADLDLEAKEWDGMFTGPVGFEVDQIARTYARVTVSGWDTSERDPETDRGVETNSTVQVSILIQLV